MATLDVLTEAQAFEALKGLRDADRPRLLGLVTAVSLRLDEACGPIVARSVTETFRGESGPLFLQGRPYVDAAASPPIPAPVITEAWSNETPVPLLAAEFLIEDDGVAGRVTRWSGYWGNRVSVTYTAGRFASTATVTEPFISAAGTLLQHWWRPGYGGGSETFGPPPGVLGTGIASFGFPNAVADMLAGELLPPVVA